MRRMAVLAVAAFVIGVACNGDTTGGGGPGAVTVANNVFSPASVNPDNSNIVTWTWNSGGTLHNVTWEDLTPGSGAIGTGSYTRDFTGEPTGAVLRYRCTFHSADFSSGMVGQVVIP